MSTDKFPFKKTFPTTGETFSACSAAEKWLKEKGFSVGVMCSPEPRAILRGDVHIPKWKNLSREEREGCDGIVTSTDWRNGHVSVQLKFDPE